MNPFKRQIVSSNISVSWDGLKEEIHGEKSLKVSTTSEEAHIYIDSPENSGFTILILGRLFLFFNIKGKVDVGGISCFKIFHFAWYSVDVNISGFNLHFQSIEEPRFSGNGHLSLYILPLLPILFLVTSLLLSPEVPQDSVISVSHPYPLVPLTITPVKKRADISYLAVRDFLIRNNRKRVDPQYMEWTLNLSKYVAEKTGNPASSEKAAAALSYLRRRNLAQRLAGEVPKTPRPGSGGPPSRRR